MAGSLQGKIAIVTGSGQSIGRAIALFLAAEGAAVITNSRTAVSGDGTPTAKDTAAEIQAAGGKSVAVYADVGTMAGAKALVDSAMGEFGGLDILINNAGFGPTVFLEDMSEDIWDSTLDTNLKAHFATAFYAVPHMKARGGGRILNVISRVGLGGAASMTAYAAAKAGAMGFTFALAKELESADITVNCLAPTANTTRSQRTAAERYAKIGRQIPPSPTRTPEHVAPVAGYLVGPHAGAITGQIFYAAAGEITHYAAPTATRSIYKDGKWTLAELAKVMPPAFGASLKPPVMPAPPV